MNGRRVCAAAAVAALAAVAAAPRVQSADQNVQAPAAEGPQLTILSPGDEAYVSGPTLLRAKVDPLDAVAGITFFVDGRQACALTKLPFE